MFFLLPTKSYEPFKEQATFTLFASFVKSLQYDFVRSFPQTHTSLHVYLYSNTTHCIAIVRFCFHHWIVRKRPCFIHLIFITLSIVAVP